MGVDRRLGEAYKPLSATASDTCFDGAVSLTFFPLVDGRRGQAELNKPPSGGLFSSAQFFDISIWMEGIRRRRLWGGVFLVHHLVGWLMDGPGMALVLFIGWSFGVLVYVSLM